MEPTGATRMCREADFGGEGGLRVSGKDTRWPLNSVLLELLSRFGNITYAVNIT